MINICLFGAGRIARVHAANVAAHPALTLRTVVDIDLNKARTLAEPFGARAGTNADAALADPEVHAVLIASTSSTHADLIDRALATRKPVFCEKPIDLDVARAEACVRSIEAAGVPVFVDFNRRFDPNHAAVHQAVRAGEAGAVELISITSRDPEPPPLDYLAKSPGALFRETMVHDCDMARWLLGEAPGEVFAAAS